MTNQSKKLLIAIFSLLIVIIIGTIGFQFIEGYSPLDSFAVTISLITTTAIGYSGAPDSMAGKIFTMFLIIVGVSLVAYAFGTIVGFILEGHIKNIMGRSKMQNKINKLKDHIILCGAGRVGRHVILRLMTEKVPFVVIDKDEEVIKNLMEDGVLVINDDAAKDEVLLEAGINNAKGLITALPGDAENVFVTLTAKELNPNIMIVARGDISESKSKLIRAGADKVISPSVIGGRRMAISILKPVSVDFVETLIHKQELEFEIEELETSENSVLIGQTLENSRLKQLTGTMIVAIKRNEEIITNPGAQEAIQDGDLLIAIGTRSQLAELEKLASAKEFKNN
ncbi:potassium channel family protein [Phosphitispora sp. TUW77]|uniref:potassium channel family protein n=1 Tax=Phosphitispora sp. TUW77 TaxID=3152361 RepID=UPI003AB8A268